MDYLSINLVLGFLNVVAAVLTWHRGQPKFALLAGVLWIAFMVTHNRVQLIFGFLALGAVGVSSWYFVQWRKNQIIKTKVKTSLDHESN